MSRPTIGSASGKPSITPIAPATTASEVNPSARAWSPVGDERCGTDLASHADPVESVHDLVAEEADDARQRGPSRRCVISCGSMNRRIDSTAATTADSAIIATTKRPARSSALPNP